MFVRSSSLPFAAFATLVLAACSRASDGSGAGAGLHAWTKPDLLRAAIAGSPNTLNPILSTQAIEGQVETLAFDPLVATDPDGHDVPILAARVPTLENGDISKDGLAITYHLRHGVVWQDGMPFSSRDVQFTWQAIMNPKTFSATRHGYDQVVRVDTPDAYTAIFQLRRRFAPAVHTFFAHSDSPMEILPEHLLARYGNLNQIPFNSAPIGTGPYKVVRWYRGDRIEYVANDRYFLGKPHIAHIVFHFINDENAIVNEMRTHELDWFALATPRVYPQIKDISGLTIRLVPFNGNDAIQFNTAHGPFADGRLRRAVGLAIDKVGLVHDVTFGTAIPATGDLPSFMWAFDARAGTTRRDLPAARALLDAAGWRVGSDGVRVKNGARLAVGLAYRTDSLTHRNLVVLIGSMLREVGFEIQPKGYTTQLLYGPLADHGVLASGRYDATLTQWFAGIDPDDSTQFMCDEFAPNGYNWSQYCRPAVDAAERIALSHYDIPTRKRAYAVVQTAIANDAPYVYLWWPRAIEVVNSDLRGFRPNGIIEDWNAYAWSFAAAAPK